MKICLAAAIMPLAWRLLGRIAGEIAGLGAVPSAYFPKINM